ncbi:MAG: hypothetical protein Ct9H300mP19_02250 [Dehalococcoidia bacterium]|nr:MAG: hypothetical protein Ct9H300mP19_02250 [Dehalococcoidia bacterium]
MNLEEKDMINLLRPHAIAVDSEGSVYVAEVPTRDLARSKIRYVRSQVLESGKRASG